MKLFKLIKSPGLFVFLLLVSMVIVSDVTGIASALEDRTGTITGVILDVNDARIPDATVIIRNDRISRRMKTQDEGRFEVSLPAGEYQIIVEAPGFSSLSFSPLTVGVDETKRISVRLKVQEPAGLVPARRGQIIY